MDILRIQAVWSGFIGAPGYSAFHFSSDPGFWDGGVVTPDAQVAADNAAGRVVDAFTELRNYLPDAVTIRVDPEAQIIDSDTGEIRGAVEVSPGSIPSSGSGDSYAGPAGAVVNWRTNDYRFGRRIRGRTFLVPLAASSYEDDGTLTNAALTGLRNFGTELLAEGGDPHFGVWSRPRDGAGGVFASATGYSVPDMAAVLRSRRD